MPVDSVRRMAMYEYAELYTRDGNGRRKASFVNPDGTVEPRGDQDYDAQHLNWFAGFRWRVVSAQRDGEDDGVVYLLEREKQR